MDIFITPPPMWPDTATTADDARIQRQDDLIAHNSQAGLAAWAGAIR